MCFKDFHLCVINFYFSFSNLIFQLVAKVTFLIFYFKLFILSSFVSFYFNFISIQVKQNKFVLENNNTDLIF